MYSFFLLNVIFKNILDIGTQQILVEKNFKAIKNVAKFGKKKRQIGLGKIILHFY